MREAALGGAELVLAPAGWRDPFGAQYGLACASRALDNGVYLASANQSGVYPGARFGARGGVYGPDGLRAAGIAAVVPGLCVGWRARFGDTLGGRRPGGSAPP